MVQLLKLARATTYAGASFFFALISNAPTVMANDASGSGLRIASWNLGWHIAQDDVKPWIDACNKYRKRDADGIWQESSAEEEKAVTGWQITERRARLGSWDMRTTPPCGIYRATGMKGNLPVTESAWRHRNLQIAQLIKQEVRPDIIAFQEVSGRQSVIEALGPLAKEYEVCSFDGQFKVQRLAFAWRKSKVTALNPCAVHESIALPELSFERQLRPGLSLTVRVGRHSLRVLNLHLKSGCVSPLDGGRLDAEPKSNSRSKRAVDDPCPVLQKQIEPLEAVFEALADGVDGFIVIGDFNRNLSHEATLPAEAIRSDGSAATTALGGRLTNNLWHELNDGVPLKSWADLVPMACPVDAELRQLCEQARKLPLKGPDREQLTGTQGLGCRNGVGVDHIVVSRNWSSRVIAGTKIPIGKFGRSRAPTSVRAEPLLAISDHCPIALDLRL